MHTDDAWLARRDAAAARDARLIDLGAVEAWARGQTEKWASHGLHAELRPPTSGREKNALWVDLDGPGVLARIVVWDSGEWEVQRADPRTGAVEVSPYRPLPSLDEVTAAVDADLRRLGILPAGG